MVRRRRGDLLATRDEKRILKAMMGLQVSKTHPVMRSTSPQSCKT